MSEGLVDKINKTLNEKDFGKLHTPIDFNSYLEIIKNNPKIIRTSFQRLHDMLLFYKHEKINGKSHFYLFDDPFYNGKFAIFGIEDVIINLANCLKAGAEGFPIKDRILLLKGPPATGKSTIIKLLKKGLEEYSKTDEGATYSFFWDLNGKIITCPMHEEPLKLIPPEHRKEIFKELKIKANVTGDLCPTCYEQYQNLLQKHKGNWEEVLKHVNIRRLIFSEKRKKGIGMVYPKGEKEIVQNYLEKVNNELASSNLGLIEFSDLFKTEGPLNILLEASQSHKIEYNKEQIDLDTVILATTNSPDYVATLKDIRRAALKDRIVEIKTPHTLSSIEEEKIYRKDFDCKKLKKRNEHLSPHLLKMAAIFAILTRFEEEDIIEHLLEDKLKFYNNEKIDLEEEIEYIKKDYKKEAFKENAISPREMQNILSKLTTDPKFEEKKCLNTPSLFKEIKKTIEESAERFIGKKKKDYLDILEIVETYFYPKEYFGEIEEAVIGGENVIEEEFNKYIEHVKVYMAEETVKDKFTGEEENPNEEYMTSIENKIIEAKEMHEFTFRELVMNEIAAYHKKGKFNYKSYMKSNKKSSYQRIPNVIDRIRDKLFSEKSEDIIDKLQLMKHRTLSKEDQKKINEVKNKLIKDHGYCDHCATLVLHEFVDENF